MPAKTTPRTDRQAGARPGAPHLYRVPGPSSTDTHHIGVTLGLTVTGLAPLIERSFAVAYPERTIILEAALEQGVLEDRGDGHLYLPDDSRGHRVFFNAFVTRWSRWPWSRWNKAGRALKGELKANGRIHRLYDRAELSRDFGIAEEQKADD